MRLFHLELERESALKIELHPRLTVVAADAPTRALVVDAFDTLLRGRAAGLRGALVAEGARADFVVETTTGPVLPGVPMVVRAFDIDPAASDTGGSAVERAEHRHADALGALHAAEAALAEQQA